MPNIHVCLDKFIDPVRAAQRAVAVNPENLPTMLPMRSNDMLVVGNHSRDLHAAGMILTGRKWPNGATLRIAFIGGDARVNERIKDTALLWEKYVNLKLRFLENLEDAHIRIAQDKNDGSWSYLGTSNLEIPKNEPTMNYGWLEPDTSQTEYNRVVLHEFGHAFGMPHEHNHPRAGIPWDVEAVYAYYTSTQGWTREEVDQQLFARYEESQTQFSEFDKNSIMLYHIPNELTIGDYEVGWNTELSEGDIKFAEWQYPKDTPKPPEPLPARVKASTSQLYRNGRSYYGKDLEISHGNKPRWNADAI